MTPPDGAGRTLLRLTATTARGPRREGAFAVWLTVRVAEDLVTGTGPSERAHRRRVAALEKRLSSLTMPPPLRRALIGAVGHLRGVSPDSATRALSQLVTPVRETLGAEAGDAVRRVAAGARGR